MKSNKSLDFPYWFNRLGRRSCLPLFAATALFGLASPASAQHYQISGLWFANTNAVSSTNHIATGDVNRGLAYSAVSNQVYVCNKGVTGSGSTPAIDVLDGGTGIYLGSAVMTGVASGTFLLDQVGVADDGVIYSMNLQQTVSSGMKVYQWTNWQAAPYVSFSGDPSDGTLARRMGDNFVVGGSGTSTVLLAPMTTSSGTQATTNVVLFSTLNGSDFTPTVLNITNIAIPPSGNNGPAIAVCFYTNNTFLFKQGGTSIYLVQYPANFASLTSPVNALAIATNTTFSANGNVGQTVINYSPAGNLLAVLGPIPNSAPATTPVNLYSANPVTSLSSVGSTNSAHNNGNGNFVGVAALGGTGKTNLLFTLDCNNGVHGWGLSYVPAPVAPTITTPPVGGTFYTNYGPYTFSVSGAGSLPLVYYWQFNSVSNAATASTIFVATNISTFTISNVTTAASGWYDVIVSNTAGFTNSPPTQLNITTPLASVYVTNLWSLAADNSEPYLDTGYNTRGLAFDPVTMNVLLAEHSGDNIYALNATNGQLNFLLTGPTTGLPSGSLFEVGQVGVADDGVVYVCNVSSYNPDSDTASPGSTDFSITGFYSVENYTNADGSLNTTNLFSAFTGDPGAFMPGNPGVSSQDRWGDSMAVRGGGTNTEILLGSYVTISSGGVNEFGTGYGTNVAILTTQDGMTFTPTTITVTNAPDGFAYLGVAWGQGNTFWAKSPGYDLREIQYDTNSGFGWVVLDFATTASSGSLSSVCGIGLDVSNNILAGVNVGDAPNDLELFQIPTLGFPPQAYYQAFFPAYNANINGNAATTVKFPYIFSLDANNGIIALKYSIPLLPFGIVNTRTSNEQIFTWQSIIGHTYQLEATNTLSVGTNDWPHVGPAILAPSSGTLSYTNSSFSGKALFYRVKAQ
jgi:hypothetical protein